MIRLKYFLLLFLVFGIVSCGGTVILFDPDMAIAYPGNLRRDTRKILSEINSEVADFHYLTHSIVVLGESESFFYPLQILRLFHADNIVYFSSSYRELATQFKAFQPTQEQQHVHVQSVQMYEQTGGIPNPQMVATQDITDGFPEDPDATPGQQALLLDRRAAISSMIDYILKDIESREELSSPYIALFRIEEGLSADEFAIMNDELLSKGSLIIRDYVYRDKETIDVRLNRDVSSHRDTPYLLFFVGPYVRDLGVNINDLEGKIFIESYFITNAAALGADMSIGFTLRDIISTAVNREIDLDVGYVPAIFYRY